MHITLREQAPEGLFFSVYNLNRSRLFTKISKFNVVIASSPY